MNKKSAFSEADFFITMVYRRVEQTHLPTFRQYSALLFVEYLL